jgi:hypothetical protein
MFIVPYLARQLPNGLQQVWLFLERNGTHLIEIDASTAAAYAATNGLGAGPIKQVGDLLFLPVSIDEPGLAEFYSWREVVPGTLPLKEVWRPFIWSAATDLGVNGLLQDIQLSQTHTAFSVLSTVPDGVPS